MKCKVDGCNGSVRYKAACLCQKHYFRLRRNGDFENHMPIARQRYEDEKGYQFIYSPGHPLANKGQSYVSEQRVVLFDRIGNGPMKCEICGVQMTWKSCQADHIDENPRNNSPENIRPLCRRCNVWRSMPVAHKRISNSIPITFDGETKTPHEWSKDPRVSISGSAIRKRKQSGMSDFDALFASKSTHNGKPCRKTEVRRAIKAEYRAKLKELEKATA